MGEGEGGGIWCVVGPAVPGHDAPSADGWMFGEPTSTLEGWMLGQHPRLRGGPPPVDVGPTSTLEVQRNIHA